MAELGEVDEVELQRLVAAEQQKAQFTAQVRDRDQGEEKRGYKYRSHAPAVKSPPVPSTPGSLAKETSHGSAAAGERWCSGAVKQTPGGKQGDGSRVWRRAHWGDIREI